MLQPTRFFCIHGHFYQPPREDPWLGRILVEPSAAPMRHWNERIVAESYAPMGWAHRMGGDGKIIEICNCYEWISFNVGPTLLAWLERRRPDVYARVLEADAASLERWGHGNAIAQVYHHSIMPLASALDRELETAWAVADFEARFKRKPEGMWLAESAVDAASLEVLVAAGISFVILAPRQAKAVASPGGEFIPTANGFDVTKPYRVDLPSGASIAVFFYDGALSQAVAFERLLENGGNFWNRINGAATGGLLTLATDGETYGHHFKFGEMALAYVLSLARAGRDGLGLTNMGAYLAANPPKDRAQLHEPSSWSCAHGVERWRSDCGCKDGGHPDWNQKWRAPLRDALENAKSALDEHFFTVGARCFYDGKKALVDYGRVLAARTQAEAFAGEHFKEDADTAWKLLAMQEQALAAFASCAWFFDDISRIEPVNGMTFMWRAMELALETGAQDLRQAFSATLGKAVSNKSEEGTGADILQKRVLPRQQNKASLCLLALTLLDIKDELPAIGEEKVFSWPAFSVAVTLETKQEGEQRRFSGTAKIGTPHEKGGEPFTWEWYAPGSCGTRQEPSDIDRTSVTVTLPGEKVQTRHFAEMPRHIRDYVALSLVTTAQERTFDLNMATARHALSLMDPWEEAQTSMPHAWDWVALAPYILAACVLDSSVSGGKRDQAVAFCAGMALPSLMRSQAAHMVEHAMLRELAEEAPDWLCLVNWVERARHYLPETNFWIVRNAFYQLTVQDRQKALLGKALGFT